MLRLPWDLNLPDLRRIAQITVWKERVAGEIMEKRSSGYLISRTVVLTAGHTLEGAVRVRVALSVGQPGESLHELTNIHHDWWRPSASERTERTDIGLIFLHDHPVEHLKPTRYARLSGANLPVTAFGFPLFKARQDPRGKSQFRDLEQMDGEASPQSNVRTQTLSIRVHSSHPQQNAASSTNSPWSGMSGAALWAEDRLIGVIISHHYREGVGTLTALRVDQLLEGLNPADHTVLQQHAGLPLKFDFAPGTAENKRRRRRGRFFRGGIATVAILGLLIVGIGRSGWISSEPLRVGRPQAADPDLFLGEHSLYLSRSQDCLGLIGLCLGQPIDFAFEALGSTEAPGYPVEASEPGEKRRLCHNWTHRRVDGIGVCEIDGRIEEISVDALSTEGPAMTMPFGTTVTFGEGMGTTAKELSEAFKSTPISSFAIYGEGETVFSYDWYAPQEADGNPESMITATGRIFGEFPQLPPDCVADTGEQNYSAILPVSEVGKLTSITVKTLPEPGGEKSSPC